MARETLAGTDYVLRPIYDELLDQLGQPPLGCPKECQFHWGTQPLTMLAPGSSKGRYIYVEQNAEVDLREIEGDNIVVITMPPSSPVSSEAVESEDDSTQADIEEVVLDNPTDDAIDNE